MESGIHPRRTAQEGVGGRGGAEGRKANRRWNSLPIGLHRAAVGVNVQLGKDGEGPLQLLLQLDPGELVQENFLPAEAAFGLLVENTGLDG